MGNELCGDIGSTNAAAHNGLNESGSGLIIGVTDDDLLIGNPLLTELKSAELGCDGGNGLFRELVCCIQKTKLSSNE